MKMNRNLVLFVICLLLASIVLTGCNFPHLIKRTEATATPEPIVEEPVIPEVESTNDDEGEMLLHNNSGGSQTPAETQPTPTDGDEDLLIVNPGRSSLFDRIDAAGLNRTASLNFMGTKPVAAAQIVRPTETTANDDSLVIVNDHSVTYQQNQTVNQNTQGSGQLQPLSYIPGTSLANGASIQFATGATSAVISGYVPAGGSVSYNLYAFANQNFMAVLSSDNGTAVLGVSDVYGNVYLGTNQRQTSYNMYLPYTATYYVNIASTGYATNFTLQVFIPARVSIPLGRTSVSMSGQVAPYSVVSYTAYMYAGQTARIDDYSGAQPNSFLRVSGLSTGQIYMDYTAYSPSWYSVVPVTQDYLIEVISMGQWSNYTLTVDVR